MEGDKKRPKGSFLNLFDWNGKSRKKLFANVPEELPGSQVSNRGKEDGVNTSKPNIMVDEDENEVNLSNNKGSGNSDDGSGTSRAPSVVARLMGLDSLPTLNLSESSFSSGQFSDSCSLRSSHHEKLDSRTDIYATEYINMHNRLETLTRNQELSNSQRHQSHPSERFQTEVLPPRSAKSIPITHHKLLSPIKNPGFVSTRNASYVMEAAAKIIESSPRAVSPRGKIGNSSVPMRIRDLKEKMEAANNVSRPGKPKKNGSKYVLVTRPSLESEKRDFNSIREKGRSASVSLQAKTNSQRRDGLTSYGNKNLVNHKEQKLSLQRAESKRVSPESSNNNVLRQNNQKQNCVSNKDKTTGKNSVSNIPVRRTVDPNKNANKVAPKSKNGSRKPGSLAPTVKNASQKKKVVSSVSSVSSHVDLDEGERSIKYNVSMDSFSSMSPNNRKPGMDVISFTFNSPLKQSPSKSLEKRFDQQIFSNGFTISSPGLNGIGAGSLSALLEQKLLELTSKVQSYQSNVVREESSASCESSRGKKVQQSLRDELDGVNAYDSPSFNGATTNINNNWQDCEECCGSSINTGKEEYDDFSPESSFELSFETGSFADSRSCTTGSKGSSFVESQTGISLSNGNEFQSEYSILDSTDSTASSSARIPSRKKLTRRFSLADIESPSNWELEYVRNIIDNTDLALEDFAVGESNEVIDRSLFDRLENGEESSKLGRKVLFDCVNECLESQCSRLYVGACPSRVGLAPRKEWLVEEVLEEISGWKSMADWMLDELVDKEMSTRRGRWVDFDIEAFEEGMEIENAVLNSLVNEFVSELMVV